MQFMDYQRLHDYLCCKPGAVVDFPFDPITLVLKVGGKMFALVILDEHPLRMNLKCDPVKGLALRDCFPAILPGYHMNKRHWNTLVLDGSLPDDLVFSMIDDSYDLVVKGLTRSAREELARKHPQTPVQKT
jgi:predicted DNA-binding protein (MmcQ/YjbR family)